MLLRLHIIQTLPHCINILFIGISSNKPTEFLLQKIGTDAFETQKLFIISLRK